MCNCFKGKRHTLLLFYCLKTGQRGERLFSVNKEQLLPSAAGPMGKQLQLRDLHVGVVAGFHLRTD